MAVFSKFLARPAAAPLQVCIESYTILSPAIAQTVSMHLLDGPSMNYVALVQAIRMDRGVHSGHLQKRRLAIRAATTPESASLSKSTLRKTSKVPPFCDCNTSKHAVH